MLGGRLFAILRDAMLRIAPQDEGCIFGKFGQQRKNLPHPEERPGGTRREG